MNNDELPLIFVTNDDGFDSKGLRHLIHLLVPFGRVVAVAPDGHCSGKSSAISVETPLRITRRADVDGAEVYSVNGTPVDCVKLGLHAVVGRKPDILVSGINHGSNAGNSVIYSGTMGAAMEGCMVDIPSVGFSLLDYKPDADFTPCDKYVEQIVKLLLEKGLPEGICLNVNIPAKCTPEGVKWLRAARGYWTQEYADYVDPHGRPYYWLTGRFVNTEPDNDETDEYWLKRNWVSVVPVRVDQSASLAEVNALHTH